MYMTKIILALAIAVSACVDQTGDTISCDPVTGQGCEAPAPTVDTCGSRPLMPEVTSSWVSFENADGTAEDHLVFSDTDGRALVQWTRLVDAWGRCMVTHAR